MHDDIQNKIVSALERLGQAFRIASWQQSKRFGVNPIQGQVLNFLLSQRQERRTISCMAREFGLSKATLSETIKALQKKGLLRKEETTLDLRTRILTLTGDGKNTAKSSPYRSDLEVYFRRLLSEEKESIFLVLLGVIHFLNEKGTISTQRMCYSCKHFTAEKRFCKLLNKKLKIEQLQIDCDEHSIN